MDVRQTDVRCASSLNAPYPRGRGIITWANCYKPMQMVISAQAAMTLSEINTGDWL